MNLPLNFFRQRSIWSRNKMRKAIKFCLALAMVGTLAIPAQAADVKSKFTGRTTASLRQTSTNDGSTSISYMDMSAGGRFGAQFDVDGDNWKTSAKVELGHYEDSVGARDAKLSLANDTMKLTFGRQWFTGVSHGENYAWYSFSEGAGEHAWSGRNSGVNFTLLGPNVSIFYAMNEVADPSDATTDTQYNRTYLGVIWGGQFGDISVDASYTQYSDTINKDNGGLEKGVADGRTASEMGVGATYAMGKMELSLNYASWTTKDGGESVDALGGTSMDLIFDMAMEGLLKGISASYTTAATKTSSSYQDDKSAYAVNARMDIGATNLFLSYASQSTKNTAPSSKASTKTVVDATLRYNF